MGIVDLEIEANSRRIVSSLEYFLIEYPILVRKKYCSKLIYIDTLFARNGEKFSFTKLKLHYPFLHSALKNCINGIIRVSPRYTQITHICENIRYMDRTLIF